MGIFETVFSFIDNLICNFLLPIVIIVLIIAVIVGVFNFFQAKEYIDTVSSRYQNPTRPEGYRVSTEMIKCSNCDHSCRSYNEGQEWYCQKHQIDTRGDYVCADYHTCLFD